MAAASGGAVPAQASADDVLKVLLGTLFAHGLGDTAEALLKEAGVDADLQGYLGEPSPDEEDANPSLDRRAAVAACTEQVERQRHRILELQEKVAVLRDAAAAQAAAAAEAARPKALEPTQEFPLKADMLRRHREEVVELSAEVEAREKNVGDLRTRLMEAKAESLGFQRVEERRLKATPAGKEAARIRQLLAQWDSPTGPRRSSTHCFARADTDKDGQLAWGSDEVRIFVRSIFKCFGLKVPPWNDLIWFSLFRQWSGETPRSSLDIDDAFRFARHCFQAALQSIDPLASLLAQGGSSATPLPSARESARDLLLTGAGAAVAVQAALEAWGSGELRDAFFETFNQSDGNRDGRLEWDTEEVRGFLHALFMRFGMPQPGWPEKRWIEICLTCGVDRSRSLDVDEAVAFARYCFEQRGREAALGL